MSVHSVSSHDGPNATSPGMSGGGTEEGGPKKYVPPHLRNRTANAAAVPTTMDDGSSSSSHGGGRMNGASGGGGGGGNFALTSQGYPGGGSSTSYRAGEGGGGGGGGGGGSGYYNSSSGGRRGGGYSSRGGEEGMMTSGTSGRFDSLANDRDDRLGGGAGGGGGRMGGGGGGGGGRWGKLGGEESAGRGGGAMHRGGGGGGEGWHTGGGGGRIMTNRGVTGTGWDCRDGRRYYKEYEENVFAKVKEKTTGINFDSYDNIPVEVTGKGAKDIKCIDSFRNTEGVHPLLMANVKRVNYERPTPVQKNSIPIVLENRDLMACAQTGSGKTAAFLFPIITKLLRKGPPSTPTLQYAHKPPAYPVVLVLSPTRELAVQIFEESRKFTFGTGIRTVVLYGGSDVRVQLNDLDKGCDICVATPGRLTDMTERRKVRLGLVGYLVLDEADRMLDMGFAPQIRVIVEDSDMPGCDERQTVMFSATFPREIQQLARDFLRNYIFLSVGRVGSTNDFIRQRLQFADDDQKPKYLVKILKEHEQGLVLVFVETKKKADMIEYYLVAENFPVVCIHGDRTQPEREEALHLFSSGERPILVATDVAARGLDISNITHVVNCDLPTNVDDYVHRIGRTGRAGNVGLATSFVNENNRPILRDLLSILEEAGQEIPAWFQSLVMNCTSSGSRMSNNRHGGRGGRGGGGGGGRFGGNFNSRDIRSDEIGGGSKIRGSAAIDDKFALSTRSREEVGRRDGVVGMKGEGGGVGPWRVDRDRDMRLNGHGGGGERWMSGGGGGGGGVKEDGW